MLVEGEAAPMAKPNGPDEMQGRAYGRPAATYDKELIEVGPGTFGGELLRRYWQPLALSSEITDDLPKPIRILGEDLIAFRDKSGMPGLVYPRCLHRGASLLYGKIEQVGIRCPYHGWLFNHEGLLLDAPCEIDQNSRINKIVRQPWYPVIEKHGLMFCYMGPPEKQPLLPDFASVIGNLAEDESLDAAGGINPVTSGKAAIFFGAMDFNWWSFFDNHMDPMHVGALHTTINGIQFFEHVSHNPSPCKFKYLENGSGVAWLAHWRSRIDGTVTQEIRQTVVPNVVIRGPVFAAGGADILWIVPVDDVSHRLFMLRKKNRGVSTRDAVRAELGIFQPSWGPGKAWEEWTLEDHQRWQTDYMVQKSLGPINLQSDEHLTSADAGVAMMRRVFKRQAQLVKEGKDPIGSCPGESQVFEVIAGTAVLDGATLKVREGQLAATIEDF
jgi:phenylpropionate dioxygenase-like ring-hydroxylating dioxygenase large terminal subunit